VSRPEIVHYIVRFESTGTALSPNPYSM
jgi:hypothetical protein